MTVLTIRSCKRYAVRQPVQLTGPSGFPVTGLLIELSQEGCRISTLQGSQFSDNDIVELEIEAQSLRGTVRWANPGALGIRFDQALYASELSELIMRNRENEQQLRYGT